LPNGASLVVNYEKVLSLLPDQRPITQFSLEKVRHPHSYTMFTSYGNSLFFLAETVMPEILDHIIQMELSTKKTNAFVVPKNETDLLEATKTGSLLIGSLQKNEIRQLAFNGSLINRSNKIPFANLPFATRNGDLYLTTSSAGSHRISERDKNGKIFWEPF